MKDELEELRKALEKLKLLSSDEEERLLRIQQAESAYESQARQLEADVQELRRDLQRLENDLDPGEREKTEDEFVTLWRKCNVSCYPLYVLKPAESSTVINWTHVVPSSRWLSHWLKVIIEEYECVMNQSEENVNSYSGINYPNLYLALCKGRGLGECVGVEFRGTICKKRTRRSKQHNLFYLKRSRKTMPHCVYKYMHIYIYIHTYGYTYFWGIWQDLFCILAFICVRWVPIFLYAETSS